MEYAPPPAGSGAGAPYGPPTGYDPAGPASAFAPPDTGTGPTGGPPGGDGPRPHEPTGFGSPPAGRSRRGLWALLIGLGAVVVLAVAAVLVFTTLNNSSGVSFAVGSCVKRSGTDATAANCSDTNAYKVVQKVDNKDRCPDANQPYVEIRHPGGRDEILCLRPANTK